MIKMFETETNSIFHVEKSLAQDVLDVRRAALENCSRLTFPDYIL